MPTIMSMVGLKILICTTNNHVGGLITNSYQEEAESETLTISNQFL